MIRFDPNAGPPPTINPRRPREPIAVLAVRRAAATIVSPTAVSKFSSPSSAPRRPKGPFAPRLALGQWDTGCPCITMAVAGLHVYLLRAELKSRTWPRFNACITPIRPNIVGPLSSTSISVSIAACHSGKSASLFGRLGDVARRVARVISLRPSGSADRQTPGASRSNALPCLAPRTSNRTRRNRATGCRFILRLGLDTNSRR